MRSLQEVASYVVDLYVSEVMEGYRAPGSPYSKESLGYYKPENPEDYSGEDELKAQAISDMGGLHGELAKAAVKATRKQAGSAKGTRKAAQKSPASTGSAEAWNAARSAARRASAEKSKGHASREDISANPFLGARR